VLLVLGYHADLGASGGYVGVDVFFVISGFLITGGILREQERGDFSLVGFWVRRVRRVIPASTVLVAVTLVAGTFILLPVDLEELAESTVSQQVMVSNFYFWRNTDYFAGPAALKPLLHTWALAVEQQFYLVFPLLLLMFRRPRKGLLLSLFCGLAVVSFALSEWASHSHPTAAYFLLPMRAWELLLGSIIVLCPAPTKLKAWQSGLLSWLGVGSVLAAGFWFDSTTRFPGSAALLPCLGAALFIYANSSRLTLVGRVLSMKHLVFIGLLSYSLYLWHWPIFAYLRYWQGEDLAWPFTITAIPLSFVLAYLSWKFIEGPLRKADKGISNRKLVAGAVISGVVLVSVSLWVNGTDGLPSRFAARARPYTRDNSVPKHFKSDTAAARQGKLPLLGSIEAPQDRLDFLLWGDSHAMALGELCNTLAKEHDVTGAVAARSATIPLLGVWRPSAGTEAVEWNQAVLDFIKDRRIRHVILVSRWAVNVEGRPSGEMDSLIVDEDATGVSPTECAATLSRGLNRTIVTLQAEGVKVWIVKQVPLQDGRPAKKLLAAAYRRRELPVGVTMEEHRKRQARVNAVLDALGSQKATLLNPDLYCFYQSGNSKIGDAGGSFYADEDHLSPYGAEVLLHDMLGPVFREIARESEPETDATVE